MRVRCRHTDTDTDTNTDTDTETGTDAKTKHKCQQRDTFNTKAQTQQRCCYETLRARLTLSLSPFLSHSVFVVPLRQSLRLSSTSKTLNPPTLTSSCR